jgi:membrane fusion protein, multidrug efflux system
MPEGSIRVFKPTGEDDPPAPPQRLRWVRPVLMLGGVLAVIAGAFTFWLSGGRYAGTDDAYIQTDKLLVATDIAGIVRRVAVREGQAVGAGETLFELDDSPFRYALDGAAAELRQTALTLGAMQADYQRLLRDVAAQEAAVRLAQAQYERQAQLVNTNAVSRSSFDQARFGLQQAEQQVESLRVQALVQLAKLGGSAEAPVERHPEYLRIQAQVAEAQRRLDHTVVKAPFSGVVTQVSALQPGQYLAAATPAFALVSDSHIWVDALPKETDLTHVRPGNAATVTVDTYPGRVWQARVESISPASGSTFSVLPAQNASGNWVKVVQRIPVRVKVVEPAGGPPLRAGMSAVVSIDTGHERHLSDIF